MKYTHLLLTGSLFFTAYATASNQYPPENLSAASPATTTTAPVAAAQKSIGKKTAGYLGIGVDLLPAPVAAQMPKEVSKGQGIVITRFAESSPAAESGLKVSDVILSYGTDKIVHPEQFIQLIRNDKPGHQVALQILRNGKISTQQVTLGSQTIPEKSANTASNKPPANFTGLAIKKISENIYDASIGIPTQNGSMQRISFKGTREEIYKQVAAAKNIPPQQRNQLLFALTGGKHSQQQKKSNGPWNMMPFGNKTNNGGGGFFPNFFNNR